MRTNNGELREEEEAAGDLDSPASITGASSCKWALADEKATTVWTLGTDIDGEQQSVVSPMSRGDGGVGASKLARGLE
jgi:hypothetical protein